MNTTSNVDAALAAPKDPGKIGNGRRPPFPFGGTRRADGNSYPW
jgi:hypothetical protein